jgi:hypothetical protein
MYEVVVLIGFWWGNLRERDHLEDIGINGRIIFEWILEKLVGMIWTGFIWLRRETIGRLL